MSDSGELLFGDITDVDEDDDSNFIRKTDGTSYPHHLTRVAGDSDSESSSETYSPAPSQSRDVTSSQRTSNSISRLHRKRSRRTSLHKLVLSTTNTEFSAGEGDSTRDEDTNTSNTTKATNTQYETVAGSVPTTHKTKRFLNGRFRTNHQVVPNQDTTDEDTGEEDEDDDMESVDLERHGSTRMSPDDPYSLDPLPDPPCWTKPWNALKTLHQNGHTVSVLLTLSVLIAGGGCISGHIASYIVLAAVYVIYLMECAVNKTWKQLSVERKELTDVTVNLLGLKLR